MFSTVHILYIVISLALTAGILAGQYFIKNQKVKNFLLFFWAFATFFLHISSMYVDFLKSGSASVPNWILFPIHFCNFMMYMLLVVSLWPNKQSKFFKIMATVVAYGGFFGAAITLIQNDYVVNDPTFQNWTSVKSLLSHSTMMIGSLWLFVGGYVKIRVSNVLSYSAGLLASGGVAGIVMGIFSLAGLAVPNSMYLLAPAIGGVNLTMGYYIALYMLILVFIFTVIWEFFACKKGERWYNTMKKYFLSFKEKQKAKATVNNIQAETSSEKIEKKPSKKLVVKSTEKSVTNTVKKSTEKSSKKPVVKSKK